MTAKEKIDKINTQKANIKKAVIQDMTKLGTYKDEYIDIIDMYAEMCAQYNLAWDEFVSSGCKCECKTKAGGVRKTAAVTTMEELRRQIGAYSDRLCLNPKTNKENERGKPQSKLDKAMQKIQAF